MSERRRHLLVLLIVLGLIAGSAAAIFTQSTSSASTSRAESRLVYQGKATKQTAVNAESLQRALDIMRDRVDAFGVAEPEGARAHGRDQIEVNLPGVEDAPSAPPARSAPPPSSSSTTGKNVLDELQDQRHRDQRRPAARHRPLQRGQAGVQVRHPVPKTSQAAPRRASTRSTRSRRSRSTTASRGSPRRGGRRPRRRREEEGRGHRGQAGGARPARESRQPTRPTPTPSGSSATTRPVRHDIKNRSRTSTSAAATSRSSPSTSPTRAAGVPADHRHGRPARRRQRQPAEPGAGVQLAALRDRARQRARLDPVDQLPREPGRHRRLDRRPDLRRLHHASAQDLAEGPQDRRAAAAARADLALAGLGHARQAGADQGLKAGIAGFLIVALFLLVVYRVLGLTSPRPRSRSTASTSSRSSS